MATRGDRPYAVAVYLFGWAKAHRSLQEEELRRELTLRGILQRALLINFGEERLVDGVKRISL